MADAMLNHPAIKKLEARVDGDKENKQVEKNAKGNPGTNTKGKKTPVQTVTESSAALNKEVVSILKQLNENLNKQDSKLVSLTQKVDELYNYDECYDEESEIVGEQCESGKSPEHDSGEPPCKKRCTETSSIFKDLTEKFQSKEKVDCEVNEDLSSFVNNSFRNGMSDDTLAELLKDIHRPQNCEALVKTKVNSSMWRLLKPQTQTDDIKFQGMQNTIVKAAINITKLVDKDGDKLDTQSVEWGTTALALLGHSYRLINNKRKECHRFDLDPRFYPLTSSSQPYTENLYGDDINKNVKDIQEMCRIGRNLGRGSQFQNRGYSRGRRAGRRGMNRPYRGRGGYKPYDGEQSTSNQSKNQRGGHRK